MSDDELFQYFSHRQNDNTSAILNLSENIHESTYNEEDEEQTNLLFTLDDFNVMTSFIRIAVRSVLNESIDQLHILRNINSQDTKYLPNNDILKYSSIEDRGAFTMSDQMLQYQPLQSNYESSALELLEKIRLVVKQETTGKEDYEVDVLFTFDNSDNAMTSFIRAAVRCILIECIDQLFVLRNINSQDSTDFINVVAEYCSIENRYMGMENHADYRINSVLTNQSKLAKDINMLIFILQDTCDEIDYAGTINVFSKSVSALKRMHEDEVELLEIRDKSIKYIVDLRNQAEEERLYNIRTMDETNSNIQKLRFQVEDALVYGKCEVGYFENWERARREQNDMICDLRENVHRSVIADMENKIDVENRCHLELENYVEESKNDYLDEIQFWMKHYDEELERREGEMITLQNEYEKLIEDHNNLKVKFQAHREEMDDWLEFKRVRREKEEREALELWAAIKIQAWWRGTMVRKKLGPYRKKKKGKDKDKGKGKKKK